MSSVAEIVRCHSRYVISTGANAASFASEALPKHPEYEAPRRWKILSISWILHNAIRKSRTMCLVGAWHLRWRIFFAAPDCPLILLVDVPHPTQNMIFCLLFCCSIYKHDSLCTSTTSYANEHYLGITTYATKDSNDSLNIFFSLEMETLSVLDSLSPIYL